MTVTNYSTTLKCARHYSKHLLIYYVIECLQLLDEGDAIVMSTVWIKRFCNSYKDAHQVRDPSSLSLKPKASIFIYCETPSVVRHTVILCIFYVLRKKRSLSVNCTMPLFVRRILELRDVKI